MLAAAALALSHALQISDGFYRPSALTWVIASAALTLVAVTGALRSVNMGLPWRHATAVILVAGVAWALVEHATSLPGQSLPRSPGRLFFVLLLAAALSVALLALDTRRARHVWFPAALAVYAALGVWMVRFTPNPSIDVYTVYYKALHVLRGWHSPYSITFPNIYGGEDFYGPGIVQNGIVSFGFPYPPLALLMAYPGALIGDLRYSDVAAMVAGAGAIGFAGRTRTALLAAALLLFMPRGLFVIQMAWSEPLLVCWLGLAVYGATRRESTWLHVGLMTAVKQHMVLALPFADWLRADRGRRDGVKYFALAIGCAAAVMMPFFIADPAGFWRSVVTLQMKEPFRFDSLSVLVPIVKAGTQLSPRMLLLIPMAALLVSGCVAWLTAPRNASGFAAALGFVLMTLFLFSKKAFCNYYFLVLACLCAAIAAADDQDLVKS